jgi:putative aminopeptidase FrvX
MDREAALTLLAELVQAHGPVGDERDIDKVILKHFESTGLKVWQDGATNIYAHLPGDGPTVMVCAHKDEIGFVVNDVLDNGRLRIENIGGSFPWKYGEGPVEFIADDGSLLRGILSAGSIHARKGPVTKLRTENAWTWDDATVFTGLSKEEVLAKGVHIGSRGVVSKERKGLERLGDYVGCYAMDDRIGCAAVIGALQAVLASDQKPKANLYFVITHGEEIGMIGAVRAAHHLKLDACIAIDTSPVNYDHPLEMNDSPVVWYREATYNNKPECDRVVELANQLGFGAQPVIYAGAASDAGRIKQHGLADRTVCFGPARDNSHGFEIAHADALPNVIQLLVAYLNQFE